ncbi:MAG: hypothetical protein MJ014_03110 [Methanocorpusculum sp.]|nr:hypothetical protein [Methanocorpusculum sp.]
MQSVVAALNVFGEKLTEILDEPDSLAVLGSVYQDTQGSALRPAIPHRT